MTNSYYQRNKVKLRKKHVKDIKILMKKEEAKSTNAHELI